MTTPWIFPIPWVRQPPAFPSRCLSQECRTDDGRAEDGGVVPGGDGSGGGEVISLDTMRSAMVANFEQDDLDVPAFLRKRGEVM